MSDPVTATSDWLPNFEHVQSESLVAATPQLGCRDWELYIHTSDCVVGIPSAKKSQWFSRSCERPFRREIAERNLLKCYRRVTKISVCHSLQCIVGIKLQDCRESSALRQYWLTSNCNYGNNAQHNTAVVWEDWHLGVRQIAAEPHLLKSTVHRILTQYLKIYVCSTWVPHFLKRNKWRFEWNFVQNGSSTLQWTQIFLKMSLHMTKVGSITSTLLPVPQVSVSLKKQKVRSKPQQGKWCLWFSSPHIASSIITSYTPYPIPIPNMVNVPYYRDIFAKLCEYIGRRRQDLKTIWILHADNLTLSITFWWNMESEPPATLFKAWISLSATSGFFPC